MTICHLYHFDLATGWSRIRPCPPGCALSRRGILGLLLLACVLPILASHGMGADVAVPVISSELLRQSPVQFDERLNQRFKPTTISWTAGARSAQEAVAILNASGNASVLSPQSDGAQVRILPAFSGDFWRAVMVICATYELGIDDGEALMQPMERLYQGGFMATNLQVPFEIQIGPLSLSRRVQGSASPGYGYGANGPVLGMIRSFTLTRAQPDDSSPGTEVDMAYAIRFEPRFQFDITGQCHLEWNAIQDGNGAPIIADLLPTTREVGHSHLHSDWPNAEVPQEIRYHGRLSVRLTEPLVLNIPVAPGPAVHQDVIGQAVEVSIQTSAALPPAAGNKALFDVTMPLEMGVRGHVSFLCAGKKLAVQRLRTRMADNTLHLNYTLPHLPPGDIVMRFTGAMILPERDIQLQAIVDPGQLSHVLTQARSETLEQPTMVCWPAGPTSLSAAVQDLCIRGNQVQIAGGLDGARTMELSAFSGTFWQAVLRICAAYGLERDDSVVGPGQDDEHPNLVTGPLVLRTSADATHWLANAQACGLILVCVHHVDISSVRSLHGDTRDVRLTYHLQLEPRIDAKDIHEPAIVFASSMANGPQAHVEDPDNPVVAWGSANGERGDAAAHSNADVPAAESTLMIRGVPAGMTRFVLTGLCDLTLIKRSTVVVTVAAGEHKVVHLGTEVFGVMRMPARSEIGEKHPRLSLVNLPVTLVSLDAIIRDPDGNIINLQLTHPEMRYQYYPVLNYHSVTPGAVTLAFTASTALTVVHAPFSLSTSSP